MLSDLFLNTPRVEVLRSTLISGTLKMIVILVFMCFSEANIILCNSRLPCFQRNFITVNNMELLFDLSRSYAAQAMQQFLVLIRSTTVLGNQYGYNFKSLGDNFYESNSVSKKNLPINVYWHLEILIILECLTADSMWGWNSREIESWNGMSIGLRHAWLYTDISL